MMHVVDESLYAVNLAQLRVGLAILAHGTSELDKIRKSPHLQNNDNNNQSNDRARLDTPLATKQYGGRAPAGPPDGRRLAD